MDGEMAIESDIEEFLEKQPGMRLCPSLEPGYLLSGSYYLTAQPDGGVIVEDEFQVKILIPESFPVLLPRVWEIGSRIPQRAAWHINCRTDCSICLGSDLSLHMVASRFPRLSDYLDHCLVPYLYAVCIRERNGGAFYFSDLAHGGEGLTKEIQDLFCLPDKKAALLIIKLLSMKKRVANKKPCPCGCNRRLGTCQLHGKLQYYRELVPRRFYKQYYQRMQN